MRFVGMSRVLALCVTLLLVIASQHPLAAQNFIVVTINPGENIQDAVNTAPEGTIFVLRAGVHRRQSIRPRHGMTFAGQPGAVLDGENATQHAFVAYPARNVTVRGLTITRYMPAELKGVIHGDDSSGWLIEANEIAHNGNGSRTYGVRVGSNWVVRGNRIHHSGWNGVSGYKPINTVIENNEIYANPAADFTDTIGEAANIKLYKCAKITIRNNYVHDSPKKGIWVDTCEPDITIEGNRVVNHGGPGIWYEVSYRGTIRNNYVERAGYNLAPKADWLPGGGIQITNSPDVTVTGNTVVNSLNGIVGHQSSGYHSGQSGVNELRNLLVERNRIVMPSGRTGIVENIGTNAVYVSWNNRFRGNTYELFRNDRPFFWMGLSIDEGQWEAYHRQGSQQPYVAEVFVR